MLNQSQGKQRLTQGSDRRQLCLRDVPLGVVISHSTFTIAVLHIGNEQSGIRAVFRGGSMNTAVALQSRLSLQSAVRSSADPTARCDCSCQLQTYPSWHPGLFKPFIKHKATSPFKGCWKRARSHANHQLHASVLPKSCQDVYEYITLFKVAPLTIFSL